MGEESYVDASRVYVREINPKVAKDIIVKYHYSHAWTMCSCAIGIFYKTDDSNDFFDGDGANDKLIGCLVYGNPVGRSATKSICDGIEMGEVYELTRLFIHDGYGKNVESLSISQSFKYLKKHKPHIKLLISYSDPDQNHLGGIYQATNWKYQGNGATQLMPNFSVSLVKDPYDWTHSRTVFSQYGSHNIEKLKKAIGKTFYRRQEPAKHRYVYFLTNKRETKKLMKTLKHPFLPYPKNADDYTYPIETHVVASKKVNNQFFDFV